MKIIKVVYNSLIVAAVIMAILLFFAIFPVAGYKALVVESGSMRPAIKTGGLVVIGRAEEYKAGDIITFSQKGADKISVTHRVVDIRNGAGEMGYITKGDANDEPDKREVMQEEIAGKVLFSLPYLGYLISFVKKPLGFLLIIVMPAIAIIADEIKKIFRELKKRKKLGNN
ncbi:MAG: signal peptidase I [Candidatus Kuenenbacteria bacterium]